MFGIFDIIVLILVRRRECSRCGKRFWAPPPHAGNDISIGREDYACECGERYITGRREWQGLSSNQKRTYLWSALIAIPLVIAVLAAIAGYFLRWHDPYWTMSVILGVFGLIAGLICSGILLTIRSVPVVLSLRRTRNLNESAGTPPGTLVDSDTERRLKSDNFVSR